MSTSSNTKLAVTNATASPVMVYVTFAAQNPANKCCPTPVGPKFFNFLTPVPTNPLQATFPLPAKSTQIFDSAGQCFSGNIGFYIPPQCPVPGADFHHGKYGTSIAEFTLNPASTCSEAFDISCVNGVNCYLAMQADPNSGWCFGPANTPLSAVNNVIFNLGLQENAGLPGVYPVNCTVCTGLSGAKPCPTLPVGPAQAVPICNIQRQTPRGGTVTVILRESPFVETIALEALGKEVGHDLSHAKDTVWLQNGYHGLGEAFRLIPLPNSDHQQWALACLGSEVGKFLSYRGGSVSLQNVLEANERWTRSVVDDAEVGNVVAFGCANLANKVLSHGNGKVWLQDGMQGGGEWWLLKQVL